MENTVQPEFLAEELRAAFETDETMTTQPKNREYSKGEHSETTRGQIAPSFSQVELDVGYGSRVQPTDDR